MEDSSSPDSDAKCRKCFFTFKYSAIESEIIFPAKLNV